MEKVLYLIDRCRIYELLYIDQPSISLSKTPEALALQNLTTSLVSLYVNILEFLVKALIHLDKGTLHQSWSSFWTLAGIEELQNKWLSNEAKVEIEASNCERVFAHQAHTNLSNQLLKLLAEMTTQAKLLNHVKMTTDSLWTRAEQAKQATILQWISDIPFEGSRFRYWKEDNWYRRLACKA